MGKWNNSDDRDAAIWKLSQLLDRDSNLRKLCITNKQEAYKQLKQAGLDDIPANTEVVISEDTPASGDRIAALCLYPKGQLPATTAAFDPKVVWRCSWSHYKQ